MSDRAAPWALLGFGATLVFAGIVLAIARRGGGIQTALVSAGTLMFVLGALLPRLDEGWFKFGRFSVRLRAVEKWVAEIERTLTDSVGITDSTTPTVESGEDPEDTAAP